MATFAISHPEFAQTDQGYVQAKLIEAAVRMGGPAVYVWGSFATSGQPLAFADVAQGYYACHLLACSPYGTETRMNPATTRSTYLDTFEELASCVGGGVVVAASGFPGPFWPGGLIGGMGWY